MKDRSFEQQMEKHKLAKGGVVPYDGLVMIGKAERTPETCFPLERLKKLFNTPKQMKTLQDCKERLAIKKGYRSWADFCIGEGRFAYEDAAELYGRYCRFVGRAQMREEERLKRASAKDSRLLNMHMAMQNKNTGDK